MTANNAVITEMSFETALSELETIVKSLETGQAPLEDSITQYERGIALKNHCESKLKQAREKVEKMTIQSDGSLSAEPLDPQE